MTLRTYALCGLLTLASAASAQETTRPTETKVETSRYLKPGWALKGSALKASAGKAADPTLNEANPTVPPVDGPTRSATSPLRIQNDTDWVIQIRVDGRLLGIVAARTTLEGICLSGDTQFEAFADFTDGARRVWGPSGTWVSGPFIWRLVK
ncbi:MAG TPA: hypothetical protein VJ623_02650 [Holophagaceae bacterium]|nr:hypothetical protein [Holophagaceae bacterium]